MAEKEYIEREAILKELELQRPDAFKNFASKVACLVIEIIIDVVKAIPSADVEPVRHGHWILLRESKITGFNPEFAGRDPIGGYQCSNCKEEAIFDCNDEFVLSNYCPNCGAKMDGDTT